MNSSGMARWKLLSPFLFLRLHFEERGGYLLIALTVGVLSGAIYQLFTPPIMGALGLLEDIKSFVTILFPFFVAALVAVATFKRESLDQLPAGGQVTLERRNEAIIKLTRRQFVCCIFGYCSGMSLVIFLGLVAIKVVGPRLATTGILEVPYFKAVCIGIGAALFAHMLIITFWGLYYLTDRLNR